MPSALKVAFFDFFIMYLYFRNVSSTLIKSVTLTPQNPSQEGSSMTVLKSTTTTADSWNMFATDEIGFFLLLSLDNTWGFDTDSISTINITIDSDTDLSIGDKDLLTSFSISDNEYITSWLNLKNDYPNFFYPDCDTSKNPTEQFVTGDVNTLVSTDSGNAALESDRSRKAMGKHEGRYYTTLPAPGPGTSGTTAQNHFPVIFTLENYPADCCGDYLFWSLTNPTIEPLKQSCGFKGVEMNQGLQVYISTEDIWERLNISSVAVDYYVQENCEELGDIKHINWNNLMGNDVNEIPEMVYNIDVSSSDLSMSIDVTLDYLGYAYGTDDVYGHGATYQLGFHSFDGLNGDNIDEPSNCDNRLSSSFMNRAWDEYWTYSQCPSGKNQIAHDNFLAYPIPSEHWTISSDTNNSCSKIKYSAEFKWDELLNCKSFDEATDLVEINSDDNYINISGIFYVNIISPIAKDFDIGQYYVYELLSYPFVISVGKTIYVLDSVGIFLFTASVISVRKNNDENVFNMIILTESAGYISLSMPSLLSSPNNNNLFSVLNSHSNCTSVQSFICVQFWELEAVDISCPFMFTGEYSLQFDAVCHSQQQTDKCNQYIQEHGSTVSLSTNLIFYDHICDDIIWSIVYDGNMRFYDENTFTTPIVSNHLYVVGEDRVYSEISIDNINIDSNGYALLDATLLNVWLCTIDEETYGSLTLDENDIAQSGCFGTDIDNDGPYHIVVNGDQLFAHSAQHEIDNDNNVIRFSFIVPNTISRDTLYIETQIELQFSNPPGRRLLSNIDGDTDRTNQITHFMGAVAVDADNSYDVDTDESSDVPESSQNTVVMMVLVIVISVFLIISILVFVKFKCNKNNDYQHHQVHQQGELNEHGGHFPPIM